MKLAQFAWHGGFDTSLSLSKEISLVNLTNILKCFLINVFLLTGQTSVCNTVDIKLSLSLFSSSHSYSKWSIVWSLVPHEQVGVSSILNRCKYDLMFPCPVTMFVKLWVMFCVQSRTGSFGLNVHCNYLIPLPQFPRDPFQECKCLLSKTINNWYSHKYKTLFTWVFVISTTAHSQVVKYTKTEWKWGADHLTDTQSIAHNVIKR